ncbi:hypothetical protein SAMN06265348_107319 [Pedobacter westerhofensis]|uniref:Uncharacterized protein n=1 Tax=Pedobacter westerhofensis TaxID=425512 RepID=A0A521EBU6_9SPHI|nr:hypothetical protein SAMN06265348_107319 [Pedobacter westerhofensis]
MNKSVKSSQRLKLRNASKKIGIEKSGYTTAAAATAMITQIKSDQLPFFAKALSIQ